MNSSQQQVIVGAVFCAGIASLFLSLHWSIDRGKPVMSWIFGALSFLLVFGAFYIAAGVAGE